MEMKGLLRRKVRKSISTHRTIVTDTHGHMLVSLISDIYTLSNWHKASLWCPQLG